MALDNFCSDIAHPSSEGLTRVNIPDDALLAWSPADPSEALALIAAVRSKALLHSTELPDPPPEPTTCCGRGCIGCVWEGYYTALAYWRDEAVLRWAD